MQEPIFLSLLFIGVRSVQASSLADFSLPFCDLYISILASLFFLFRSIKPLNHIALVKGLTTAVSRHVGAGVGVVGRDATITRMTPFNLFRRCISSSSRSCWLLLKQVTQTLRLFLHHPIIVKTVHTLAVDVAVAAVAVGGGALRLPPW